MLHPPFSNQRTPGDLLLGHLWRFPISPLVRVTASARTTHLYVIGMSGKGMSKLLEWCLYQDIAAGRGCGLIDLHPSFGVNTEGNYWHCFAGCGGGSVIDF